MALHRLTRITLGVPDVPTTAAYYAEFGLTETAPASGGPGSARLSTLDGGEQLTIAHAPRRRLLELGVGADDPDDLDRVARAMQQLGVATVRTSSSIEALESGTDIRVRVELASRIQSEGTPTPRYNTPGVVTRENARADFVQRGGRVMPRKLGHVVVGSTNLEATHRFFTQGVGFRVSDLVENGAAFLRCSTDHHNLLVQAAPFTLLHHTSWQVDDVDDVGRGASAMLAADPSRHVWGLGRHAVGSNFFWYLKDPAGNFSEYYSDMDCIVDDAVWKSTVWDQARALYAWGPPPPPSFLAPEDLAALMTGSHSS